jgi:hypothetical protein
MGLFFCGGIVYGYKHVIPDGICGCIESESKTEIRLFRSLLDISDNSKC